MAPSGVEEADYESDPEELKRSLATRRREASDDEDEGFKEEDEDEKRPGNRRAEIDSDHSDEQSGILEYDNDGEEGLHIEGDDSYDEEDEEEYGEVADDMYDNKISVAGKPGVSQPKGVEADGMNGEDAPEDSATDLVNGEEQKQKEPFAVPTAGAFYMHDDRFQAMDGGSNRRMRGGKRLRHSRDERKWGHDKYEEMNTHEKQYDRTPRGRFRGRGQGRGRGYSRGSNSKAVTRNGHQNQLPKALTRGRGPRRYEVALRNDNQAPSVQSKQSQNSFVKVSDIDSGRVPTDATRTKTETIFSKKNVVASSLNSASPPFYPSGSSNNLAKKNIQAGMSRLHMNENPMPSGKKYGNPKSSSLWVRIDQPFQTTNQSRGATSNGQELYQQSLNQGDKASSTMQAQGMPKGTDQSCPQPHGLAFDPHPAVISLLPSSPPKTGSSKNEHLSSEIDSATETGALVAKGKGTLQPSGMGSFMYGGNQFMGPAGSMAAGHGNPNFPTFLPVMQFGGQHGGVPTFGMALPGYVQPEHGTGNPEMTWLPILTGPGSLGASYCPPYAAVDGSYQSHKPGLLSSAESSSQDTSSNNPNDEERPVERVDVTNNGTSQRTNINPNKQPSRYSEMRFSK